MNRAPVPALRLNPALPSGFEHVVNKALEKDRKMRYQSAADLGADLRRLRRETDSSRVVTTREVGESDEQSQMHRLLNHRQDLPEGSHRGRPRQVQAASHHE